MKKQLSLYSFLFLAALVFSCGGDDEDAPPNKLTADVYVESEGDFKFTADTDEFTAVVDGDQVVIIGSADNDFDGGGFIYLSFDIRDVEEGETYDLFDDEEVEMFMVHDGSDNGITSGEIRFNKVSNKLIEATFEFVTYSSYYDDDMEITDGEVVANLIEADI